MEDHTEKFSEDPEEQMRIENELLRIKLQAQFGNAFSMETNGELPPEIEHQFLKHVMQFEENLQNAEYTVLGEKLNLKDLPNSEDMTEAEIIKELDRIEQVMAENNIYLDRMYGPYPPKTIYDFITQELLLQEVDSNQFLMNFMHSGNFYLNDTGINDESADEDESEYEEYEEEEEGEEMDHNDDETNEEFHEESASTTFRSGLHFVYEEFYPNHDAAISKLTLLFFNNWEAKNFNNNSTELSDEIMMAPAGSISKDKLLEKMGYFFDSFKEFTNLQFKIGEINFTGERGQMLLGHSEGYVKYIAVLEDGDSIEYEGGFKLYLENHGGLWQIMYFVIPGWVW